MSNKEYLTTEVLVATSYAGIHLARFNLSWLLAGEKTGDGEVPDWLSG